MGYRRITSTTDMREGLTFPIKPFRFRGVNKSYGGSQHSNSQASSSGSKRKSDHDVESLLAKKPRSNSQKSKLSQEYKPDECAASFRTFSIGESFTNRILSCLAISPAGRPLREFGTVKKLLQTLRDSLKAHESLYYKGKTLHRDIS